MFKPKQDNCITAWDIPHYIPETLDKLKFFLIEQKWINNQQENISDKEIAFYFFDLIWNYYYSWLDVSIYSKLKNIKEISDFIDQYLFSYLNFQLNKISINGYDVHNKYLKFSFLLFLIWYDINIIKDLQDNNWEELKWAYFESFRTIRNSESINNNKPDLVIFLIRFWLDLAYLTSIVLETKSSALYLYNLIKDGFRYAWIDIDDYLSKLINWELTISEYINKIEIILNERWYNKDFIDTIIFYIWRIYINEPWLKRYDWENKDSQVLGLEIEHDIRWIDIWNDIQKAKMITWKEEQTNYIYLWHKWHLKLLKFLKLKTSWREYYEWLWKLKEQFIKQLPWLDWTNEDYDLNFLVLAFCKKPKNEIHPFDLELVYDFLLFSFNSFHKETILQFIDYISNLSSTYHESYKIKIFSIILNNILNNRLSWYSEIPAKIDEVLQKSKNLNWLLFLYQSLYLNLSYTFFKLENFKKWIEYYFYFEALSLDKWVSYLQKREDEILDIIWTNKEWKSNSEIIEEYRIWFKNEFQYIFCGKLIELLEKNKNSSWFISDEKIKNEIWNKVFLLISNYIFRSILVDITLVDNDKIETSHCKKWYKLKYIKLKEDKTVCLAYPDLDKYAYLFEKIFEKEKDFMEQLFNIVIPSLDTRLKFRDNIPSSYSFFISFKDIRDFLEKLKNFSPNNFLIRWQNIETLDKNWVNPTWLKQEVLTEILIEDWNWQVRKIVPYAFWELIKYININSNIQDTFFTEWKDFLFLISKTVIEKVYAFASLSVNNDRIFSINVDFNFLEILYKSSQTFPWFIKELEQKYPNINKSNITFELVEDIPCSWPNVIDIVNFIKESGYNLAIDDFWVQNSNMQSLLEYREIFWNEIYIKIDMIFVRWIFNPNEWTVDRDKLDKLISILDIIFNQKHTRYWWVKDRVYTLLETKKKEGKRQKIKIIFEWVENNDIIEIIKEIIFWWWYDLTDIDVEIWLQWFAKILWWWRGKPLF